VSIELQLRSTADGQLINKLSANLLDPDYFSFSADGTAAVGTADAFLKTNPNVLQVLDTRQGSSIGIELPTYTALFIETPHQRGWRLTLPRVADQPLKLVHLIRNIFVEYYELSTSLAHTCLLNF
jgi:hypothetical protein